MTRRCCGRLAVASGIVIGVTACASSGLSVSEPRRLGRAPLCEASGTARAPWDPSRVLVADNEVRDALFVVRHQPDGWLGEQTELPLPEIGPEDIEALAAVGETLVLVGSHGRSGSCVPRPESRWIDLVRRTEAGNLERARRIDVTSVWTVAMRSVAACLGELWVQSPPEGAEAVCQALVAAEQTAQLGDCLPLDIEAAAAVANAAGRQRLWLGLRRPRVNDLPVLLRLAAPLDELRFDAVALVEGVGDRGVRSMTVADNRVWLVVGPAPADFDHSALWWTPARNLERGGTVRGRIVTDQLPPNSEGLVVGDDQTSVLLDGDEGETKGAPCRTPSRIVVVR